VACEAAGVIPTCRARSLPRGVVYEFDCDLTGAICFCRLSTVELPGCIKGHWFVTQLVAYRAR
jgi:hypothetical protein